MHSPQRSPLVDKKTIPKKNYLLLSEEFKDGIEEFPGGRSTRMEEKNQDVFGTQVDRKRNIAKTVVLYIGFLTLGVSIVIVGPTLLDLQAITGTTTDTISFIFTSRQVGALFGAVATGFLMDRYDRWVLLGVTTLVLGITMLATPFCTDVVLLIAVMAVMGIAAGFYEAGGNVTLLKVWGKDHGPWMQALHCIFGIGALIAPLVAEPFLATSYLTQVRENNSLSSEILNTESIENATTHNDLVEHGAISVSRPKNVVLLNIDELVADVESAHGTTRKEFNPHSHHDADAEDLDNKLDADKIKSETQISYAYILSAIPLIITTLAFTSIYLSGDRVWYTGNQNKLEEDTNANKTDNNTNEERKNTLQKELTIFIFTFYLTYCILEINYGNYLLTFAVKQLHWTKKTAASLVATYWGSFTGGRAMGIVMVKWVSPEVFLGTSLTLMLLSSVPLFYAHYDVSILWICSIIHGLGTSTVFATGITWTAKYIHVTTYIGSVFMMASAGGEMIGPLLIGVLFKYFGPMAFVWVMCGASLLALVLFIIMQTLASRCGLMNDGLKNTDLIESITPVDVTW